MARVQIFYRCFTEQTQKAQPYGISHPSSDTFASENKQKYFLIMKTSLRIHR